MPERPIRVTEPGSSALADAVTRFNRTWADFQGSALRFERERQKRLREQAQKREREAHRNQAAAATRTANQTMRQLSTLNSMVKSLASANAVAQRIPDPLADVAPLEAAQVIRIGRIQDQDVSALVREANVPALVALLDQGNIVIEGQWGEETSGLLAEVVLRALAGTGAGQLAVISIDPSLRTPLAFLDGLRAVDEGLYPLSASSQGSISSLLEDLRDEVKALRSQIAGVADSLGRFRRLVQQPVGVYRCVVITDFPSGFDDAARALLLDLMREAPSVGMSFLIQTESGIYLDDQGLEHTLFLEFSDEGLTHSAFPGRTIALELVTLDRRVRMAQEIVERAKDAEAPSLAFAEVQSRMDGPWDSSARGITASIGISGATPLEFTLGSRSSQLHNVLVSGAVGQGKSNALMVMVHSLALRYSPEELQMYLLDFKDGMTLYPLAGGARGDSWLPNAELLGLASDRAFGAAVLSDLIEEFERRSLVMRPFGDSIESYREAQPAEVMPRMLIVVDEFQVLFEEDDEVADAALKNLEKIARRGRAYGMHLCLASQTLSGITKLLAKQDGIFAQFPVRVALKNSESESRVVLSASNTAASRLRPREVILNSDFGAPQGNVRGVVAYADPQALQSLRKDLASKAGVESKPKIFNGEVPASLVDMMEYLRDLHVYSLSSPASGRVGLLGLPMGLSAEPRGVEFLNEPGNNVAVIGSGSSSRGTTLTDGAVGENLPIGVLQAMLTSAVVQSPNGGVHVVLLDFLTGDDSLRVEQLRRLLELLGCGVEHLRSEAATQWLIDAETHLAGDVVTAATNTYVVGWGMDRMKISTNTITRPGDPLSGLARLATTGPQDGVHFIGWWNSYGAFASHAAYDYPNNLGEALRYRVVLRVSPNDVKSLFGQDAAWRPEKNRGYFHDALSHEQSGVVVPFRPLTAADVDLISREAWESHD